MEGGRSGSIKEILSVYLGLYSITETHRQACIEKNATDVYLQYTSTAFTTSYHSTTCVSGNVFNTHGCTDAPYKSGGRGLLGGA